MGSHAVFSYDRKPHEPTFRVLRNCQGRATIRKRHQIDQRNCEESQSLTDNETTDNMLFEFTCP